MSDPNDDYQHGIDSAVAILRARVGAARMRRDESIANEQWQSAATEEAERRALENAIEAITGEDEP